jgi:hypothetical protein
MNFKTLKLYNLNFNSSLFIYIIEYISVIFSSFLTFIIHDICDGNTCNIYNKINNLDKIAYNSIDFFHYINAFVIILHMYNEIKREFGLKDDAQYFNIIYKYSFQSFFVTSLGNITLSSIIVYEYSTDTFKNMLILLLHTLTLIPVLLRSHNAIYDKKGISSVIFKNKIYHTYHIRKPINYKIQYPENVYI